MVPTPETGLKKDAVRRSPWWIVAIAVAGVLLSGYGYYLVYIKELQRAQANFKQVAADRVAAIQLKLASELEMLSSIRAFYHGSEKVTRREFHEFVQPLLKRHPSIRALAWVARVPHDRRQAIGQAASRQGWMNFQITERQAQGKMVAARQRMEYFPVYFLEPHRGNETVLGFDLASQPGRRAAMERARDSGEMMAIPSISLPQEYGNQVEFLVFLPVYRKGATLGTVNAHRKNLKGFVLGVFRSANLLEETLATFKKNPLDVFLFDGGRAGAINFLAGHRNGRLVSSSTLVDFKTTKNSAFWLFEKNLQMAGRSWRVLCLPHADFLQRIQFWQGWLIFTGGLLLTGLVCIFLKFNSDSADRFRQLANRLMDEIHDHQQTTAALKSSEERLRILFEYAPDAFYLHDLNGVFIDGNRAAEELVGYKREELVGKNIFQLDVLSGEAKKRLADTLLQMERQPDTQSNEFVLKRKDGGRVVAEIRTFLIEIEGQTQLLSIARDITARTKAEQSLRESEEKFRQISITAQDAIIMIDELGRISFWNPAAEKMFGYPYQQALGRELHPLIVATTDRAKFRHAFTAFQRTGHGAMIGKTRELKALKKDGTRFPIELSLSALKINGNWQAMGIIRDISERKRLKRKKRRLQAQVNQNQKLEAIGTLAGGIAHDFNNILSAIIGYATLALDEAGDDKRLFEQLQEILQAGRRARDLVKQILTFSRQDTQKLQPVQVRPIVKETMKLLRATLPANIEIRTNIESDACVMANPTQIQQVVMNLCVNAGHAMQTSGGVLTVGLSEVRLDARGGQAVSRDQLAPGPESDGAQNFIIQQPLGLAPGRYLDLTVKDTGCGMAQEVIGKIFDPFFTTREKGDGTGMGLSVVHGIAKTLEGTVTVASAPKKGAIFNVYLPILESPPPAKDLPEVPAAGGSDRILFVDDEKVLADLGRQMLERRGYVVSVRTSSIEALELFKARSEDFDLVITDMTMPNMTGKELTAAIRRIRKHIPVILCTGFSAAITREEADAMGIDAFIHKPILWAELLATIRQVMAPGKAKEKAQYYN